MGKSVRKPLKPQEAQRLLKAAVRLHGMGRLEEADAQYDRLIRADPANAQALQLKGVLRHQEGDDEAALALIDQALTLDPNYADAHANRGHVLHALGRAEDALAAFNMAVFLAPSQPEMHLNLGNQLKELGRLADAIDSYDMAVSLAPGFAEAFANKGAALEEMGHLGDAEECLRHAIRLRPDYAEAHALLGGVLTRTGMIEDAVAAYREALRLNPADAVTRANLTGLYVGGYGSPEDAIAGSMESLALLRRSNYGGAADRHAALRRLIGQGVASFRLKHDVEQADYLAGRGVRVDGLEAFVEAGRGLLERAGGEPAAPDAPAPRIKLSADEADALLPYLQSPLAYPMTAHVGDILNPEIDWAAEERKYFESGNQIVYVDGFLAPDALRAFQDFALSARVWNKEYRNKYLGAFSDQGFISPLHLALGRALQEKMPKLFGPHRLGRFWGFKYDARLGKGINVHADFASVNLNFWITPDEYNLDPAAGGLKIYDVPSPANWGFRAYNQGKDAIYRFIEEHRGGSVTVPYRCNRAVLFNSAYFHETDAIAFKDVYEGRRVNITYLFGSR